jgi:hypothetical protein
LWDGNTTNCCWKQPLDEGPQLKSS